MSRLGGWRRAGRAFAALSLGTAVLVADFPGPVGGTPPAEAFPGATVDLVGHGFGHGRGMGQFGSLGYAVNHGWDYQRITDHYYGGTRLETLPPAERSIRVHITRFDRFDTPGIDVIVGSDEGGITTPLAPGREFRALRVRRLSAGRFAVDEAEDCGGGPTATWKPLQITGVAEVTIKPRNLGGDHRADMLQLCDPSGTRWVRGQLQVLEGVTGGKTGGRLVNQLDIDAYLRGVVPRESPASWGTMGNGAGMHALRAQAVAARSYALAGDARRAPWAQTCDTVECQVYGGHAEQVGGTFRLLEAPTTDQAVAETAAQVRVHTGGSLVGKIARTEFSSSTGGWSAGGVFPAVIDEGDAVEANPSRVWTAKVPVEVIEAAKPEIGTLLAVDVTERNGLGAMDGRVLELQLRGTEGKATMSGAQLRLLYSYSSSLRPFGIRSDWFRVLNNPSGGLSGYWVGAADGGVFSFGDAKFHGSTGGMTLNHPVLDLDAPPSGGGYWMAAGDGGIFSFGDAGFFGSTGNLTLNRPVVGMAPTGSGEGYWLVASDGGIFAFGDAGFFGSMGDKKLNSPIVGMATPPSGDGYWLLAADGGLFAFGAAGYHGSLPQVDVAGPAAAMRPTRTGDGYLIVTEAGEVVSFGDAPALGSVDDVVPGYRGGVVALEVKAAPEGS